MGAEPDSVALPDESPPRRLPRLTRFRSSPHTPVGSYVVLWRPGDRLLSRFLVWSQRLLRGALRVQIQPASDVAARRDDAVSAPPRDASPGRHRPAAAAVAQPPRERRSASPGVVTMVHEKDGKSHLLAEFSFWPRGGADLRRPRRGGSRGRVVMARAPLPRQGADRSRRSMPVGPARYPLDFRASDRIITERYGASVLSGPW